MSLSNFSKNLKIARIDSFGTTGKIIFGCNSVNKVSEEVIALEGRNVLIITDKSFKKIGLLDKLIEPLKKRRLSMLFSMVLRLNHP